MRSKEVVFTTWLYLPPFRKLQNLQTENCKYFPLMRILQWFILTDFSVSKSFINKCGSRFLLSPTNPQISEYKVFFAFFCTPLLQKRCIGYRIARYKKILFFQDLKKLFAQRGPINHRLGNCKVCKFKLQKFRTYSENFALVDTNKLFCLKKFHNKNWSQNLPTLAYLRLLRLLYRLV